MSVKFSSAGYSNSYDHCRLKLVDVVTPLERAKKVFYSKTKLWFVAHCFRQLRHMVLKCLSTRARQCVLV